VIKAKQGPEYKGVGRKNSKGRANEKKYRKIAKTPKNSTIKPLSEGWDNGKKTEK